MSQTPTQPPRRLRTALRLAGLAAAFALPPVAAGAAHFTRIAPLTGYSPPPAFDTPQTPVPVDPGKRTAVVIMSNTGTELTDFLAPYEILAATGAFNVLAVAPEARITPLGAGLDIVPHFSFAGYDALIGADPDVIVVPFINDWRGPANRPVVEWIKTHAGPATTLLTICGGAVTLAETGLLDGRSATTYWDFFAWVPRAYPAVQWVQGQRYVDDGNIVSSAGIANGIPATLHVVEKLLGKAVALETAQRIGFTPVEQLTDPRFQLGASPLTAVLLANAFRFDKTEMGVVLQDGVGELDLAAVLDTYPRSGTAITRLVADTRRVVRSRHGLFLVPRWNFATAPRLDRIVVPGARPAAGAHTAASDAPLTAWARDRHGLDVAYLRGDLGAPLPADRFPFDLTLADLARGESAAVARWSARGLEYTPADPAVLQGAGWPLGILAWPLALGLLGLAAARSAAGIRHPNRHGFTPAPTATPTVAPVGADA